MEACWIGHRTLDTGTGRSLSLFLGISTFGFFVVSINFALMMDAPASGYFAPFDVGTGNYLWLAPPFLALFPLWIRIIMWTVGRATTSVIAGLLSLAVIGFAFLVPVIAVQRAFPPPVSRLLHTMAVGVLPLVRCGIRRSPKTLFQFLFLGFLSRTNVSLR